MSGVVIIPVSIYLFKVNNRNARTKGGICSKLTIKVSEQHHWRCSGVFVVNFDPSHTFFSVFIVNIEQVNACWDDGYNNDDNSHDKYVLVELT